MADIAAAVGIAPSAFYRHFSGKQELLLAILDEHLSGLEQVAAEPGHDLIERLAALALERRAFGVLWEREAGHLPEDQRRTMRHRLRSLADALVTATSETVADQETADLRAWAALSVLDSPSHHRTQIEPIRFERLLRAAARAVLTAPLPKKTTDAPPPSRRRPALVPASRREALLAAAIRLFSERGYPSVALSDIGAAAGIAGPSVYNHFDSKIDVLTAALNRGNEALWAGLHRALAWAEGPADALEHLVADYADFAAADTEIVSILVSEIIHLPEERRAAFRRAQVDYITEWVALLTSARSDLTSADARVLVQAVLTMINSLSRIHHLQIAPDRTSQMVALAQAILSTSAEGLSARTPFLLPGLGPTNDLDGRQGMPFTRSGQTEVWWDFDGDGTPILLINGLSSPSAAWFRLVPLLAPQHRVITFDNPGTGRTRTPSGPYTMEMLTDAAVAVIQAAGESAAHVLGISMGGLIAQELTLDYPHLVSSLTLVATHAGAPHMSSDQDSLDAIKRAADLAPEERTLYLAGLAYVSTTPPERIDEDLTVRAQHPTSAEGYSSQLAASAEWERLGELHKITCPTLVLHGDQDRLVSPGNARILANQISTARLTVLTDCGHQLFTDQPAMGANTLLDFLASVDDAGPEARR